MRLATFNLENLDDAPGVAPPLDARLALLRGQLARLDADVLCLQEVNATRHAPRPAPRVLSALDTLLTGTQYQDFHRACSALPDGSGPLDVQNLVILSRFPVAWHRQYWHDLMTPPSYAAVTADAPGDSPAPVGWDRPTLHAAIEVGGRLLHVLNLHLRAPLAAFIPGQKQGAFAWRTVPGWAEGFFLAAIKRNGQALEARFAIDRLFDEAVGAEPWIALCGDMNADAREMPLRILRGEVDDTGNGALASRMLIPIDQTAPEQQRYSVLHGGRAAMLDHVLISRPLLQWFKGVEIHNEALGDELAGYAAVEASPESYHAPVVAEFDLPGG
ncbi:MAG: endonuclease/exonuclease/phosphatase family protein [Alphaproteobacteria bacterium]